jgi:hypothetical protein
MKMKMQSRNHNRNRNEEDVLMLSRKNAEAFDSFNRQSQGRLVVEETWEFMMIFDVRPSNNFSLPLPSP